MKRILLTLSALTLLVSCNVDNLAPQSVDAPEAQLSIDLLDTKASTTFEDGVFTQALQKGDLIGVHLCKGRLMESPVYDPMNVKYKVGPKGNLISIGKPIKMPKEEGYSIVAYYPYKDNYDPAYEKKFFTVREDQSSKEDFELSNFMNFSQDNVTASNPVVKIEFTSRVAIAKLVLNEEQTGKVEAAYINAYLTGGMAFVNGRPTFTTEGDKANIRMHQISDDVFAAYVPAQYLTPGAPLFTINYVDGTSDTVAATAPLLMETAKITELQFTKDKKVVEK